MTEHQLQRYAALKGLPVYDESDPRTDAITHAHVGGAYRRVRECISLREVEGCLADPRLVPLGGLRAGHDGGQVVVVYFGEMA